MTNKISEEEYKQEIRFGSKFPLLRGTTFVKVDGMPCVYRVDVERCCLDKSRVRRIITQVHSDYVENLIDDEFEELKKRLDLE